MSKTHGYEENLILIIEFCSDVFIRIKRIGCSGESGTVSSEKLFYNVYERWGTSRQACGSKLLYSLWKELFILDIQFKFVGPDIVDTRIGKMNYTQLSEDSKSCNKAERLEKLVAEYQPDIVLLDIVKCDDTLKSDYSKVGLR